MKIWLSTVLLCGMVVAGCYDANQQGEAAGMVDMLYASIDKGDWNRALSLYGRRFYQQQSREAWKKELQSLHDELGPIQQRTLEFAQRDAKYRYDAYIFGFNVRYARGKTKDIITIYRAVDGKGLHIVAHKITRQK